MNVYFNAEGMLLIEFAGSAIELDRAEAEQLFVDIGHALQDHDITKYDENMEEKEQPHVNQRDQLPSNW